jgi:hypothetical protein
MIGTRGKLRQCPECGGSWPQGPDHALRGCAWLHGLDRTVSPSNNELLIHDGAHGQDRFLQMELKAAREQWPMQTGQLWTLKALAGQARWTVLILRGDTRRLDVHRVTSEGVGDGIPSHVEAVRRAVNSWLKGRLWRDAEELLKVPDGETLAHAGHTCGWARVDGLWTCIQDFYAIGYRPDTACGQTLAEFSA